MDDFESRAYNKACKKEHDECMANVEKGIILDGQATKNWGSSQFPTAAKDRVLEDPGLGSDRIIESE